MPYTINFVGLTCFIKNGEAFLAALPNGKKVSHSGKDLEPHYPYLIARTSDIDVTSVMPPWPCLFFRAGMAFFDISDCVPLTFEEADQPDKIDYQQFSHYVYDWHGIDPKFKIANKDKPNKVTATVLLRQGLFRARRMPKHEALIGQVDLATGKRIKVSAPDGRYIIFKDESDIVIANVSKKFAESSIPDTDPDDFFIYYELDDSGGTPGGKPPTAPAPVQDSDSKHPFITSGRDLHVACSPTFYS